MTAIGWHGIWMLKALNWVHRFATNSHCYPYNGQPRNAVLSVLGIDAPAAAFYAKFGFRPFSERGPRMLILRMSEIEGLLCAEAPPCCKQLRAPTMEIAVAKHTLNIDGIVVGALIRRMGNPWQCRPNPEDRGSATECGTGTIGPIQ